MMTLFELFDQLGQATWQPVWVPVLTWTVLATPLWWLLKQTDWLHPHAEYRLSQVLLATLPGGLAAAGLFTLMPAAPSVVSLPEVSVAVGPSVGVTESEPSSVPLWTWTQAIGLFTAGAIVVGLVRLGRLILDVVAARRVRATLDEAASDSVQAHADRLSKTLDVGRPVRVCLAPEAVVPVTLGGIQPTILLPLELADTDDALQMTLVHECIHIRRYDDVAHVAERVVAALCGAHPLVSALCQHIAEARERACDAAVLDDDHAARGAYARLLAAFAERPHPGRLGTLSLSESPSSLTTRLNAMRSSISGLLSSPLALGTTLVGVGLALTLGVVACSDSIAPSSQTADQASATTAEEDSVYMKVEEPPRLVGGMNALHEDVTYPEMAKDAGIEGRVIVQFVIDEQGNVQNPEVSHGVHKLLNEAALEAVKQQEFEPGMQDGEPVKIQMSIPVTFKLPENSTSEESGPKGEVQASETPGNAPQIQGGIQALQEVLSYPDLARKAGIEGRVLVTFTVDKTGDIQNPRVTKSVHDALDAAAVEAVKSVSFTPAEKNGEPVATEMTLPITFNLPDEQE